MAGVTGYSDRINHAFAFAAKHHDKQVRKGTALPYLTHPANVAVILTRYGRDENTVLAGILRDVVADSIRDGQTREDLEERIGAKFGQDVLATVLAVTVRTTDDAGVEMASDERKDDLIERLAKAGESAQWLCAAHTLHNTSAILADLKRTSFADSVWARFSRGAEPTAHWYRRVYDRLYETGFRAPIMDELRSAVERLEESPSRATSASLASGLALLVCCALTLATAGRAVAQGAAQKLKGPDFSGVWTLNLAKSEFGGSPVPRNDTSKIVRSGTMYQMDQTGDFGPERGNVQHTSFKWPATDGEATTQMQQGAALYVKVTIKGDTSVFTSKFSMQGRTILEQTGRDYLSAGGKQLTHETDLTALQNGDAEPIHMVLVYDKR
jgi:HD domain